ncbi:MAG: putative molybdenum carrier protein [Myxococcota bacterium]
MTVAPIRTVVEKLVSGGQSGADRAALDVALELGLDCGGWVPRGRLAEDGAIPERYPNLVETESRDPAVRTERNVRDSDATVIVSLGALHGGSALTRDVAARLPRRLLHIDLACASIDAAAARVRSWLADVRPRTLNVAGPRASEDPRIFEDVRQILCLALATQAIAEEPAGDRQ